MPTKKKITKSAKPAPKKATARKPVPKKPAPKAKAAPAKKPVAKKKVVVKKPVAKKPLPKKPVAKKTPPPKPIKKPAPAPVAKPATASKKAPAVSTGKKSTFSETFLKKQHARLLNLKDLLLDNVRGVNVEESDKANAFGMHQADAGSDAYDRDFALTSLSHSHNSLREIDQALDRLAAGTYGMCENCGKLIPQARLEALPHTRYTVGCQGEIERDNANHIPTQQPTVSTIWGLEDEESEEENEEEFPEEK